MLKIALALALVQTQPFDIAREKPPLVPPNQVAVLGSAHLSDIPAESYPATFEPLIEKLARYQPQIITIEASSGADCDFMRAYPARYADTVEAYCWDPAPARVATGLSVPAAVAEIDRLLGALGGKPTPAQRRRLAAVFLAAGERASALVQWLRLPPAERRAGEGLDDALIAVLERLRTRHSEEYAIAAPLAARLGLDRVYPADDHTSDFHVTDEKAYGAAVAKQWDNAANQERKAIDDRLLADFAKPGGLLALYRGFNAATAYPLIYRSDFGAALGDPSPQGFGRQYVGYWEVRNLRMVAHVRETLVARPGQRVLAIVGASHKPYFEAYLRPMHDVHIVDIEALLK